MAETALQSKLESEIVRFRAAQALGRSAPLAQLFDFLAAKALKGEPVGEIDLAVDVFGKTGTDPGDASVRVYIHRLRKKLDDFYARSDVGGDDRLVIPRGEYRLALADRTALEPADIRPAPARRRRLLPLLAAAVLLAAGGAGGALLAGLANGSNDPIATLKTAPVWEDLAGDPRPITIVVGDYYIFGEAEDGEVRRLVREFDVNSRLDLETWLLDHPDRVGRYVDLNLNYAPIGAVLALNTVAPIARQVARDRRVRIVTATELTPDMLREGHVIYVGYLSGLGPLENTVFNRSNFSVGLTYDEIVDDRDARVYITQAGRPGANQVHTDYGYLASFKGPSGGRILVLAGARDIGVMQTAEAAASPEALSELSRAVNGAHSLEGVYEVEGLGRQNLMGRLILSAERPDLDVPQKKEP